MVRAAVRVCRRLPHASAVAYAAASRMHRLWRVLAHARLPVAVVARVFALAGTSCAPLCSRGWQVIYLGGLLSSVAGVPATALGSSGPLIATLRRLYPPLIAYATGFVTVPAVRATLNRRKNRKIEQRNAVRRAWGRVVADREAVNDGSEARTGLRARLKRKLKSAAALRTRLRRMRPGSWQPPSPAPVPSPRHPPPPAPDWAPTLPRATHAPPTRHPRATHAPPTRHPHPSCDVTAAGDRDALYSSAQGVGEQAGDDPTRLPGSAFDEFDARLANAPPSSPPPSPSPPPPPPPPPPSLMP